jgi:hypothetical protein
MVDSSVAHPWAVLIIMATGIYVVVPVAVCSWLQNQAEQYEITRLYMWF